jgi:Calcineurin-like phosphoesterase
LQDCTEVFVAGDLHGHIPNFMSILKAADLANNPTRHLVLQELIHSEFFYPNGGDKSHQLVDLYAALKCQFPKQVHYLPGNHELAQMTGRQIAKAGGTQNALFAEGVKHAYGATAPEIIRAYNDLFRLCPLALRTPNEVYLCHTVVPAKDLATFDPMRLLEENYDDKDYLPGGISYGIVWGRDTEQTTVETFLRKVEASFVVTGHIATSDGYQIPNTKQIIVDCAGTPAAYLRFRANEPMTFDQLRAGIVVL